MTIPSPPARHSVAVDVDNIMMAHTKQTTRANKRPLRQLMFSFPPMLTELLPPDPQGMLTTGFYVAANGYGAECGGLLGTCIELGHDEGEESVLRGVMTWERKAAGRGERVRPRLCHAAMVGDVARVQRLVRAGAWLMGTEEEGCTALMLAVEEEHVDVVRELLACEGADAAFVGARIAADKVDAGHSAFSIACGWARDHERKLTEGERAAHATIVRLLVGSGRVGPGDLGGSDATALRWACEAGLPDVVTTLLADARCTAAIVAQRGASGSSPFSIACWAYDPDRKLSVDERTAYATIVRLLAARGHVGPCDLGGNDATAFAWTCRAGLPDVVTTFLLDPRCTAAVIAQRSDTGRSAFSHLCSRSCDSERRLTEDDRETYAKMARLLIGTGHVGPGDLGSGHCTALDWACAARLPDVVTAFLADARCTAAVVAQRGASGHAPFSTACDWGGGGGTPAAITATAAHHPLSSSDEALVARVRARLAAVNKGAGMSRSLLPSSPRLRLRRSGSAPVPNPTASTGRRASTLVELAAVRVRPR